MLGNIARYTRNIAMKPHEFNVIYAPLSNEFVDRDSGNAGKNSRRYMDARKHTPVEHHSFLKTSGKYFKMEERAIIKGL